MKTSYIFVPAIFALAAAFANADDYKDFGEVDTNDDGQLSSQELRSALPGLQPLIAASGATGANDPESPSDVVITREQIAEALPGIEFEETRGPIDEDAYDKIVEELEDRDIEAQ